MQKNYVKKWNLIIGILETEGNFLNMIKDIYKKKKNPLKLRLYLTLKTEWFLLSSGTKQR